MLNSHVELVIDSDAKNIVARINKLIDEGWELRGHIIPTQGDLAGGMAEMLYCATLVRKQEEKKKDKGLAGRARY